MIQRQQSRCDFLSHCLDQLTWLTFYHSPNLGVRGAVGHRRLEVIVLTGPPQAHRQRDIDREPLSQPLLLRVDSVVAIEAHPLEQNFIWQCRLIHIDGV